MKRNHDTAIRAALPGTARTIAAAIGTSSTTARARLQRLDRLGCVRAWWCPVQRADVWRERDGATWAHLDGLDEVEAHAARLLAGR